MGLIKSSISAQRSLLALAFTVPIAQISLRIPSVCTKSMLLTLDFIIFFLKDGAT